MKKFTPLLLLIVYTLYPLALLAQSQPFVHFTEDDGLAGNKVTSILKDADGYLWIGTNNGLSKYDGRQFVNFRKADGLPGNRVWALASDGKNRIYVGCYKDGLAIIENNKVTGVYHFKSKFPNSIRRLHYSEYFKMLVVGTDDGIFLFKDSTFYEIPYSENINVKKAVLSIVEYKKQIYFTSHTYYSRGGIYNLHINKETPLQSDIERIDKERGNMFSLAVINDTLYSNSNYIIFAYPILQPYNQPLITVANKQFLPWVACPLSNQEILLGGYGEGVYISDLKVFSTITGILTKLPYNVDTRSINDLLYDKTNNLIWVCSDNGLFCLMKTTFESVDLPKIDGLIDIAIQDDIIYFLTKKGVYLYQDGEIIQDIQAIEIAKRLIEHRKKFQSHISTSLQGVFPDQQLTLSGFKHENNLLYLVTSIGSISIPIFQTYLPFYSKNYVTDGKGGAYYIADYSELLYFPSMTKRWQKSFVTGNQGHITDVLKIIRVNDVVYLASAYNGLYAIKEGMVYYLQESNSELDNNLTDIETNDKGEVWCTSAYGNMFSIGFDNKLFVKRKLNEQNSGIVGENYKWLKFNNRNLYVGTNKGLTIIPKAQLNQKSIDSLRFYNDANGFDFISAGSPVTDSYGNVYIHTSDKLFKIKSTQTKHDAGILTMQNVMLNNTPVRIDRLKGQTLSYSTTGIALDFFIIRYPTSKNATYRYRVNTGNWIDGSKMSLQSLKSGKYTIELEAKDIEINKVYRQQISFTIALPFWQQWWFILLTILTFGLISYLIIRWRIRTYKIQQEEKNRLIRTNSDLQIQSLQVQMNPHFVFNSLNSIQNFILSSKMEDALLYLGYVGSIIRMNLENVSKDYILLEDEIMFLTKYIAIEKLRFKEKLDIRLANNVKDQGILIPPMLVQPIIENAIKHGTRHLKHAGIIQVGFAIEHGLLQVTIEDNGVGRTYAAANADANHKSLGLALTKKRLTLLNEKNRSNAFNLHIEDKQVDGQPSGTLVLIDLQIIKAS